MKIIGIVHSVACAQKIKRYLLRKKYSVLVVCSEQHKEFSSETNMDVSQWDHYDAVFYTETVSVGIDFTKHHFDCFLGVYSKPMCADQFVQGLFRCWNYISKHHYIIMRQSTDVSPPEFQKFGALIPSGAAVLPDYALFMETAAVRYKKNIYESNSYIKGALEILGFVIDSAPNHGLHKHPPNLDSPSNLLVEQH
jgi:hypothetical protein